MQIWPFAYTAAPLKKCLIVRLGFSVLLKEISAIIVDNFSKYSLAIEFEFRVFCHRLNPFHLQRDHNTQRLSKSESGHRKQYQLQQPESPRKVEGQF